MGEVIGCRCSGRRRGLPAQTRQSGRRRDKVQVLPVGEVRRRERRYEAEQGKETRERGRWLLRMRVGAATPAGSTAGEADGGGNPSRLTCVLAGQFGPAGE